MIAVTISIRGGKMLVSNELIIGNSLFNIFTKKGTSSTTISPKGTKIASSNPIRGGNIADNIAVTTLTILCMRVSKGGNIAFIIGVKISNISCNNCVITGRSADTKVPTHSIIPCKNGVNEGNMPETNLAIILTIVVISCTRGGSNVDTIVTITGARLEAKFAMS